ncbi:MAG: pantoate--beta-alanine ligase [Bacteroidia bacterium]
MEILRTRQEIRNWREKCHGTVGFVPTMGALHQGHLSLVQKSLSQTDTTLVSIFVNPRQFGPEEDFDRYPRTLEADLRLLSSEGVHAAFTPPQEEIYCEDDEIHLSLTRLSRYWCGAARPGHFDGVSLVVTKLFNLVQPTHAYFGEKDFQQLRIVQKLVSELFFPITIVPCPIVRQEDGLALSSRNQYLSPEGRAQAIALYKALEYIKALLPTTLIVEEILQKTRAYVQDRFPGVQIDYLTIVDEETLEPLQSLRQAARPRALIAAYVEGVRLIDNMALHPLNI